VEVCRNHFADAADEVTVGCELAPWKEFLKAVDDVVKATDQARHFIEVHRFIHAYRPPGTCCFNSSNQLRMTVMFRELGSSPPDLSTIRKRSLARS